MYCSFSVFVFSAQPNIDDPAAMTILDCSCPRMIFWGVLLFYINNWIKLVLLQEIWKEGEGIMKERDVVVGLMIDYTNK